MSKGKTINQSGGGMGAVPHTPSYTATYTTSKNYSLNYKKLVRDNVIIGVDMGSEDYTVKTWFKTPGRLRKLLRRLKLDRSKWEYKVVKNEHNTNPPRKATQ